MTDQQAISVRARLGHVLDELSGRIDYAIHELRTARRSVQPPGGNPVNPARAAWTKGIDDALRMLGPVEEANVKLKELLCEAAVDERERELLIAPREASSRGRA
jgi:hypothetical protein